MKILILGSGLLGVTTAYELSKRGFQVTVIDRQSTSAAETSYANGGQLSYSHAEPWANLCILKKLPKWILDPEAPLVFRPRADWQMIKWGLGFLRNCTPKRADRNCLTLLRLGLYSKEQFTRIRTETGIEFDFNTKGILNVFGNDHDFDVAKRQSDFQSKFGGGERELTREQVLEMEPALAHTSRPIVGGMHDYIDECGDSYRFCNALADYCATHFGTEFRYGVDILGLQQEGGSIVAVDTSEGEMSADGYVMAMGSYSPLFLRPLGIDLPIYPMKGYSLTLEADEHCPEQNITDATHKIVFTRLGSKLRIAGTAEFAGYNADMNEKRITPILRASEKLFPKVDWSKNISRWACLRPSTPDGPPILGPTPYRNLFLNTGHGTLGWTQAAASATIVADIMEQKKPAIMMQGLTMERYL